MTHNMGGCDGNTTHDHRPHARGPVMARIRSVKPEICESETMAKLSAAEERTFVRLWTHCDDHGRAKAHPKLIAAALFPLHDDMTAEVISDHLDALEGVGLIIRYSVDDVEYLVVTNWDEHQHPQRPSPSKIPPPTPADLRNQHPSARPRGSVRDAYRPVVVEGEGEGEGEGVGENTPSSPALADVPSEPEPSADASVRAPNPKRRPSGDPAFDAFWAAYPRRCGKPSALKAWAKAVTRASPAKIIAAAEQHRDDPNRDDAFTKHPSTWLNNDCWDDPPLPPRCRDGTVVERNRESIGAVLRDERPSFRERMAQAATLGDAAPQRAIGDPA